MRGSGAAPRRAKFLSGFQQQKNPGVGLPEWDARDYGGQASGHSDTGAYRLRVSSPDAQACRVLRQDLLGEVTRESWNSALGTLVSVMEPNGTTTAYAYDGFGQLSGETFPGGADRSGGADV